MKFNIIADSGLRLFNQYGNSTSVILNELESERASACVMFGSNSDKRDILAALKEIEEYVKKDL